jgi:hypothetical protein
MFEISLHWWVIVLILLAYCIPLILSGLGIYYLVKGNFNKSVLIVSSFVFLIPIVFIIANNLSNQPKMFEDISRYFFDLLRFLNFSNLDLLITGLLWRAIVYLSSFAVVNSVYILFRKIVS